MRERDRSATFLDFSAPHFFLSIEKVIAISTSISNSTSGVKRKSNPTSRLGCRSISVAPFVPGVGQSPASMRSLLPLVVVLCAGCALPSRGYECLAPANPGGGWDLTCRAVAQVANELAILPQTLRVSNLPGAGGGIAFAHAVAERRGEENVILSASPSTTLRLAERQFGDLDVDDVRWVGAVAADFGVITVATDAPFRNLGDLIHLDVGCELEHLFVLRGAVLGKQLVHHGNGAAMMLNHERQKQPIEIRTLRRVQLSDLIGCGKNHCRFT